ncbi:hypothetical protein EDC20_1511 [Gluconobacter oxydans]|nr:hypothetical protein EDC20_1511 [Gluconobacter oxydans]
MISGIPEWHSSTRGNRSMTDHRQSCSMADCEALFVEGLRQFVDACAYINAALPNEAEDAHWTVTMPRLAASAAEAAENLEGSKNL